MNVVGHSDHFLNRLLLLMTEAVLNCHLKLWSLFSLHIWTKSIKYLKKIADGTLLRQNIIFSLSSEFLMNFDIYWRLQLYVIRAKLVTQLINAVIVF